MEFSIRVTVMMALTLPGTLAAPRVEDASLQEFAVGNRKFTSAVYKELTKINDGNFITSPLSAQIVLALTNEGAKGDTSQELLTGLSLPNSVEKTQQALKIFLPKLRSTQNNLTLNTANKIYAAYGVKLESAFHAVARDVYDSDVENVNFAEAKAATDNINQWVESKTNNKIQNLLSPNDVDDSTKLVLVNTLYFSGKWVSPFSEWSTSKKKFYKTKENTVDVDMMSQTDSFNYYENTDLNAKFLEMRYQGGDVSLVVVLPNDIEGLNQLEQNLEKVLEPQPWSFERVYVELPRFKIDTTINFIPILKNLGIKKIFTGNADLSGLSSNEKELYVSAVIQKAFINVTESGTEAAAATFVVATKRTSAHRRVSKPVEFIANHGFIYFIKLRDMILFSGRII